MDEVARHSIPIELPAGTCRILDLEALIRAKEAMGRDHDTITVKHLREIQRRSRMRWLARTGSRFRRGVIAARPRKVKISITWPSSPYPMFPAP
jgi:hypothetical protein